MKMQFTKEDWKLIANCLSIGSNWYEDEAKDPSNKCEEEFKNNSERAKNLRKEIINNLNK